MLWSLQDSDDSEDSEDGLDQKDGTMEDEEAMFVGSAAPSTETSLDVPSATREPVSEQLRGSTPDPREATPDRLSDHRPSSTEPVSGVREGDCWGEH